MFLYFIEFLQKLGRWRRGKGKYKYLLKKYFKKKQTNTWVNPVAKASDGGKGGRTNENGKPGTAGSGERNGKSATKIKTGGPSPDPAKTHRRRRVSTRSMNAVGQMVFDIGLWRLSPVGPSLDSAGIDSSGLIQWCRKRRPPSRSVSSTTERYNTPPISHWGPLPPFPIHSVIHI